MRRVAFFFSALALCAFPAFADDEEKQIEYNTIVLQGLNKVTGHVSKFDGPLGTILRFGNLEIVARRCWKSLPEERPESAGLLEISELRPGEQPKQIFLGWMFASSPGLSGLEHPVYDITVLGCEVKTDAEKKDDNAADAEKKDDKKEEKKDEKKEPKKDVKKETKKKG